MNFREAIHYLNAKTNQLYAALSKVDDNELHRRIFDEIHLVRDIITFLEQKEREQPNVKTYFEARK